MPFKVFFLLFVEQHTHPFFYFSCIFLLYIQYLKIKVKSSTTVCIYIYVSSHSLYTTKRDNSGRRKSKEKRKATWFEQKKIYKNHLKGFLLFLQHVTHFISLAKNTRLLYEMDNYCGKSIIITIVLIIVIIFFQFFLFLGIKCYVERRHIMQEAWNIENYHNKMRETPQFLFFCSSFYRLYVKHKKNRYAEITIGKSWVE